MFALSNVILLSDMQANSKHKKMVTISEKAAQSISSNQVVIGRLMALFNKSSFTINRWIAAKNAYLTTPGAVEIIRQETGLSEGEILEKAISVRA